MNINGGGTPAVTGAYTNSKSGASTVLYDIDMTSGKLFKQDPRTTGHW
jgi:hypothetical protein